jgi:ActR/RegA family two-component response regulator
VGTAEGALRALEREPFDLAFLDLRLGDGSGVLSPAYAYQSVLVAERGRTAGSR